MGMSAIADERIQHVSLDAIYLSVGPTDGRRVGTPMACSPRLTVATGQQWAGWEAGADGPASGRTR